MSPQKWFLIVVGCIATGLVAAAALVWWVDPYFHYRAPSCARFHYTLDNQRFQNDGIVKHFDYRALVTGSSMCENFKASDVERLWGLKTVKVPFSGASYRELSQLVATAVRSNPKLALIIVGLDFNKLIMDANWMRTDLGRFPDYLYDDDPWNDACYLLSRDAVWKALKAVAPWGRAGMTSFDEYSCWHTPETRYGAEVVLRGMGFQPVANVPQREYTAGDAACVAANIRENLDPIMASGRTVLFFVTPYSAARMYCWLREGRLERQLQAERQLAEAVLRHPHAHLFSFHARTDVTGELSNYRDLDHYGPQVSTRILEWMRSGAGEWTRENLSARVEAERKALYSFDYKRMIESANKPAQKKAE